MRSFDDYVEAGSTQEVMLALELLTRAYVSQCGISLAGRTVVYCAAERWQLRLAFMDLPLSDMARKDPLFRIMSHISDCYDPEEHDEYDICGLNNEELLRYCHEILESNEFDDSTNEVLCWGISEIYRDERFIPKPISMVMEDGTILTGTLRDQSLGWTSVEMSAPFSMRGHRYELDRNPERILGIMYIERQQLMTKEKEIRSLYEEYKTRYQTIPSGKKMYKYRLFMDVYESLIGDTCLTSPEDLFSQWYGLEFYDLADDKDPSWVTEKT